MKTVPAPSRSSICEAVATLMRDGEASLPKAAYALKLSPRSLQRRLSDIGTSFSELVVQVRLDTACYLLRKSDLSLATIAGRLGYRYPSSFSRFFMRLMKMQPAVYRRLQMAELRNEQYRAGG